MYLLMIALSSQPVGSATVPAASCAGDDVQAALDAAIDGDVVTVPAGACRWDEQVLIDALAVTLQGAGKNSTVITVAPTMLNVPAYQNHPLHIISVQGKPFRVSGLGFVLETADPDVISVRGDGERWRIDSCKFVVTDDSRTPSGVYVAGLSYGVVDHCEFFNTRVLVYPNIAEAHLPHNLPIRLGSAAAVYVEDCTFEATGIANAIDSNGGGAWVFRNNQLTNIYVEAHSLQNAFADLTFSRATKSWEVYDNVFYTALDSSHTDPNPPSMHSAMRIRSGTGVVFGNTVTQLSGDLAYQHFCILDHKRCYELRDPPLLLCDGTNPLDGNEDASGYPCLDQPGRGTNLGAGSGYQHPQLLEPIYAWGNEYLLNTVDLAFLEVGAYGLCPSQIIEGRDFFDDETPRPGYQPYTYPHPLVQHWPPAAQTDFTAPTVPYGLVAEVVPAAQRLSQTSSEVTLTWQASTDAGSSGLAGYCVWVDGKSVTCTSDPTTTSLVLRGLFPWQTYELSVSAFDGAGNESLPSLSVTVELGIFGDGFESGDTSAWSSTS